MQPDEQELELIDAEYTRHLFYGSRKIMQYLRSLGHTINRKRVQRLIGVRTAGYGMAAHQAARRRERRTGSTVSSRPRLGMGWQRETGAT